MDDHLSAKLEEIPLTLRDECNEMETISSETAPLSLYGSSMHTLYPLILTRVSRLK